MGMCMKATRTPIQDGLYVWWSWCDLKKGHDGDCRPTSPYPPKWTPAPDLTFPDEPARCLGPIQVDEGLSMTICGGSDGTE